MEQLDFDRSSRWISAFHDDAFISADGGSMFVYNVGANISDYKV